MKKFNFKLEDILKLYRFQQEQAEAELGKALGKENLIQQSLDAVAFSRIKIVKELDGVQEFEIITSSQQYLKMLDVKKETLLNDLAQAKLVTEQKRKVLQEKMKKTSALEKLKEKELENYQVQELLEEENLVDDIVTSRYLRK